MPPSPFPSRRRRHFRRLGVNAHAGRKIFASGGGFPVPSKKDMVGGACRPFCSAGVFSAVSEVLMTHLLKKYLSVAMMCCAIPFAAQALEGNAQVFRLQNGLSVVVRKDTRFPLVSVRLFVKAGSAWEKPEEAGMSHFLEHLVFKGSKTSGAGVDKLVESAGGSMNAYTSYDMTTFLNDLPSAKWKMSMKAVRDLAFDPLLRQEDIDAELEVVLAEMRQRGDDPGTRLFLNALGRTLKGTPYENPVIGNEKALRAMTPEMIRSYITRRYDPRDMVLCVVGDVSEQDVLSEAEKLMGTYENHNIYAAPERYSPEELAHGLSIDVKPGPWKKSFVSLSFPIGDKGDPLQPAADVLCQLLAGDETSLLYRALHVDRNIVDSVDISPMVFERVGALLITAQMDEEKVPEFLRCTGSILRDLKASGFTEREMARARLNIEDSYLRSQERIAGIAEVMGHEFFYDPASLGGKKYLAAVRDSGADKIQQVIDAWIRPDALTVTGLVPDGKDGAAEAEAWKKVLAEAWPETAAPAGRADKRHAADEKAAEKIDLGGGCSLVLLPDHTLPYITAGLAFRGGELLVPDDRQGLAMLTASALVTATAEMDYQALAGWLADRASSVVAMSGMQTFSLTMDAPRGFAPEVFARMVEIMEKPAFRPEDVERAKREQIAAIASSEESAMGIAGRELRPFLFGRGLYSHRQAGLAKDVAAYAPSDLAAFWEKQSRMPWVLSVAGDFTREEALKFASSLKKPSLPSLKAPDPEWGREKSLVKKLPGRDQAVYLMLFPTVGTDSPDRQTMRLLAMALNGFTGKLHQDLREKQSLGYSVFPVDWVDKKAGLLGFGIVAAPENLEKAKTSFIRVAKEISDDLLPAETLERAKAIAEANYYKSRQSRSARAGEGAANALDGRPMDYAWRKLEELKAVSAEDIRAAAARYIDPERCYELTVRP